jgi:hypothetical protein
MSPHPTERQVREFWEHMQAHFGTQRIDKNDSVAMQNVAEWLGTLKVMDPEIFLHDFSTTIGEHIYTPFTPGIEVGVWDRWDQIVVCVHEHQHVVQRRTGPALEYEWEYVVSSAARAQYEVEAIRSAQYEINWRYRRHIPMPNQQARLLKHYGCTEQDIRVSTKALALAIPSVRGGQITTEAGRVAVEWLDQHFDPVS